MSTAPPVLIIVDERDHVKGPDIAPVTLLAYCDFECPYSGQIYPIIETLLKQVGDHVQYIFRHFPVLHKHAHAQHAAEAAEAAGGPKITSNERYSRRCAICSLRIRRVSMKVISSATRGG